MNKVRAVFRKFIIRWNRQDSNYAISLFNLFFEFCVRHCVCHEGHNKEHDRRSPRDLAAHCKAITDIKEILERLVL